MSTVRYSPGVWGAFESVFRPWMSRRMDVRVAGLPSDLPNDRPLLVVANHVSWWDGFLVREVQRRVRPNAPLYTVMLQQELDKRWFFRPMGGLGLTPGSLTSVRQLIRQLADLRGRQPNAVVSFFPQGKIWPSFRRPLEFEPGLRVVMQTLSPCVVLPLALHIEPGNRVKPTAYESAGPPVMNEAEASSSILERLVQDSLDRVLSFLGRHGERARELWPEEGETLPAGDAPQHRAQEYGGFRA